MLLVVVAVLLDGLTRSRVGGADSVPGLGSGGLSLGLIIMSTSTVSKSRIFDFEIKS